MEGGMVSRYSSFVFMLKILVQDVGLLLQMRKRCPTSYDTLCSFEFLVLRERPLFQV